MVYQQADGCIEIKANTLKTDTIVSLATPIGRGSIGVLRVSGPLVSELIPALFTKPHSNAEHSDLLPRSAYLRTLFDEDGQAIDQVIAIRFVAPYSFTGEDVLEIQAHGGKAVMQMLLHRTLQVGQALCASFRTAQPGEFSKRAFLNGKIDLSQAQAIAGLIEANNESAVKAAMRSLRGDFSQDIHDLQNQLHAIRIFIEATLDFPDEEIEFIETGKILSKLDRLCSSTHKTLVKAQQGSLLQEGIRLAIIGLPNTGKSSLFNVLAGADKAIVTPIAGTTRDKIEDTILIHDIPIHFVDTAGLRNSDDEVEAIGIERSWQEVSASDIILFLSDGSRAQDEEYIQAEDAILSELQGSRTQNKGAILHLINKSDLFKSDTLRAVTDQRYPNALKISTKTQDGFNELNARIAQLAGKEESQEGVYLARHRHIEAIELALTHMQKAREILSAEVVLLDLAAEELKWAQKQLDTILGEHTADDLLGQIFSSFCIGK